MNETRRAYNKTPALQPKFDLDAAKASIKDMQKRGGYNNPFGGSVEEMDGFAQDIVGRLNERFSDLDSRKDGWAATPEFARDTLMSRRAYTSAQLDQNVDKYNIKSFNDGGGAFKQVYGHLGKSFIEKNKDIQFKYVNLEKPTRIDRESINHLFNGGKNFKKTSKLFKRLKVGLMEDYPALLADAIHIAADENNYKIANKYDNTDPHQFVYLVNRFDVGSDTVYVKFGLKEHFAYYRLWNADFYENIEDLLDSVDIDGSVPSKTSEQIEEILTRHEEERNNEVDSKDTDYNISGSTARWTDDRIDSLIADYGASNPNCSQTYAVLMNPRDYLSKNGNAVVIEKNK